MLLKFGDANHAFDQHAFRSRVDVHDVFDWYILETGGDVKYVFDRYWFLNSV